MRRINDTLRRGLSHSFFVKRGSRIEYIKAGDLFRQRGVSRMSENARILALGLDGQKIAHVRFRISFRRGRSPEVDGGSRIMALKPFLKLYSERVKPILVPAAPELEAAE